MAQSWTEITWEIINYGRFINQFLPNIIKSIRQFERINKKIRRQKMSIMFNEICINEEMLLKYTYSYIYIYIYIYIDRYLWGWTVKIHLITSYLLLIFFINGIQARQHHWKKCKNSKGTMLKNNSHFITLHKNILVSQLIFQPKAELRFSTRLEVHTHIYIYIYTFTFIIYIYIYIYIYTYIHLHIYVYTYFCIHVCIYIYIIIMSCR